MKARKLALINKEEINHGKIPIVIMSALWLSYHQEPHLIRWLQLGAENLASTVQTGKAMLHAHMVRL
jgi:hypothetical protein